MVVNVEKLLKMGKMVIFKNLTKNGEMLKNVGEKTFKNLFCSDLLLHMDIKKTIFNPKFYQHFFAISSDYD